MKTHLVSRLSKKYLLPNLPLYKSKGHIVYHKEIEYFLQGFSFESSAFDKNLFTIYVFVQPLFIPVTYLTLTFGNRLGVLSNSRDIWWKYDESKEDEIMGEILSKINSYGVPFLEERNKLEKFLSKYDKVSLEDNPNKVEGLGYIYVLLGEYPQAMVMLSSFNQVLIKEKKKNNKIVWLIDMQDRVQLILNYLENQNFNGAIIQLNKWRNFTLEKLGFMDY